ncbi:transglycosylase domain-containing protein [Anaerorhabdus furcosa]|uniref:Penicillin binding protein transpeptidase domain-containing protein n=1 Tax=Anaerorhabdus furcosa TaxID=118967 RepID=A0A1T4Q793_9FIRM|nr:transglycosylase domain-containing protein [Anaerorhabdus furcosa]SJZ99642.1 Penicillin binding protein transpeptidase domain-containing protein [Anaerorhabdus furcosa]
MDDKIKVTQSDTLNENPKTEKKKATGNSKPKQSTSKKSTSKKSNDLIKDDSKEKATTKKTNKSVAAKTTKAATAKKKNESVSNPSDSILSVDQPSTKQKTRSKVDKKSTKKFIEEGFADFESRLKDISLTINETPESSKTKEDQEDTVSILPINKKTVSKKDKSLNEVEDLPKNKNEGILEEIPMKSHVEEKKEDTPTQDDEIINNETPKQTDEPIHIYKDPEPEIDYIDEGDDDDSSSKEEHKLKLPLSLPTKKSKKQDPLEETILLKKITPDFDEVHKPSKKSKPSKTKQFFAGLIIVILCIGLIVGGVGLGIVGKILSNTPELNLTDFTGAESSKIYDANGESVAELGAYLRENITYDDLPESVVDAFVAIEDSRFFTHPGFDLPRFTKAFIENIKSGSFAQGGSTFTMQLVKNTYFSIDDINNSTVAEKSIDRKVQEIYLALKIERDFNKHEIFEKYLNKLNFGGNIRGIQKASLYYFGKDISEVTLSEAALLAGIVNLPNKYNPYNYLDLATQRRDSVIDMMAYHGYITKDEADLAKAIKVEDLLIGEENTYNRTESQYQSYIDAVISEAQTLTGKDPALASMKIYTYMNKDVQEVIDSIQDGTAGIPFPDDLIQTAMVCMDNRTGAVIGVGGGRNYEGARLLNRATSGFRQPGSAVKPFLSYALAFENLYWSSKHVLTDRPYTYRGSSLVLKNFDGKYRGDVIVDQAVAQSLNIPAIDTLQQVLDEIGKEEVVKYLQTIGFSKVTNENFDISYAIGGSSFETTVFEMAGAHAMIINGGVYNQPHTIQKIVMQDGTVVYPENQNVKVLSSGSAYLVAELMQYAVDGPYFNYMQVLKRDYPVYAKTGTSDWAKDGLVYNIPKGAAKDKWMIASSTQFTNAVWVGYDKGVKDKGTYFNGYKSGLNLTGKISVKLMNAVEKTSSTKPTAIQRPNDIEDITYILGSYPYAYADGIHQTVTAEIRKGHPALTDVSESYTENSNLNLGGISASILPDGSLSVSWYGGGGCSNGVKDLTLNDGKNYIPASGACIFDRSASAGASYYATVYIDEVPLYNISSGSSYYQGWPGDLYGSIKVCGGFSTASGSSNTQCAYVTY